MDKPLVIALSRDRTALFAAWREQAYKQMGLFAALVAMAALALLSFQRRKRVIDEITAEHLKGITAEKEKAVRASAAKSRFLAAVSHDLRQPVQALSLYHGVLAGRAAPQDAPALNHMSRCISSLAELLGALLDLSKLEAGVVSPKVADFAIRDLLATIASGVAPEAERKGLRLHVVATGLTAHTDPVLFDQVVRNLATNAVRYTSSGGVVIGCRRRQGKLWIEVWDTGIGIPESKIEEIFEEFRQLESPEGSHEKGTGLGLAIVKKTADLLGVEIRVCSRLGKGSMFAVEVPREGEGVPEHIGPK
jgi:signal transduction histidine kinase